MDYPKSVPNVGLVGGKFVDENTATGQVGSLIPSAWGTAVTDEIINVIKEGGFSPKENENNQLAAAIKEIIKKGTVSSNNDVAVVGKVSDVSSARFINGNTDTTDLPAGVGYFSGIRAKYNGGKLGFDFGCSMTGRRSFGRLTLANGTGDWFEYWTSANFNPDLKVNGDDATGVGFASANIEYPYIWSKTANAAIFLQRRLDFTPLQQGGGIGQANNKVKIGWSSNGLKATVDESDLGFLWCENNFKPSEYIKKGQSVPSFSNPIFGSGNTGAIGTVNTVNTGSLQITNEGNPAASASICFHRTGVYAAYLGLDTDNQFKVGGASMGLVSHTLWHSGNRPKDTALLAPNGWSKNADTGEIIQWLEYSLGDFGQTTLINVTWPFRFPNQFLNARISFKLAANAQCGTQGSYSLGTVDGCAVRIEEWAGVVQTGLIVMVEARGN